MAYLLGLCRTGPNGLLWTFHGGLAEKARSVAALGAPRVVWLANRGYRQLARRHFINCNGKAFWGMCDLLLPRFFLPEPLIESVAVLAGTSHCLAAGHLVRLGPAFRRTQSDPRVFYALHLSNPRRGARGISQEDV